MGISGPGKDVLVLIGTQQVDSESIAHLQMHYPVASTPLLNELRGGIMDGQCLLLTCLYVVVYCHNNSINEKLTDFRILRCDKG